MKNNDLKKFIDLVEEMRRVQAEYFKTRNYATMKNAMFLEKEVDAKIVKLKNLLSDEERAENEKEPSLFDEGDLNG